MIGGAFSPIIATALLAWSGGASWPIAAYIAVMAIISFVSVYLATETFQTEIAEDYPQERQVITGEPAG